MLYFLKGILYVFKGNSMHRVFFKQKHHPRSKWLLYIWKSSLLYKNFNNTILRHTLSQGLLCALKATVSKEHYTLLKGRICIHVCIYIYTMSYYILKNIIQWIMLFEHDIAFSKWCFLLQRNIEITPLLQSIFFMQPSSTVFKECRAIENTNGNCYPSREGLLSDYYLYGRNDMFSLRSVEDITGFF